MNGRGMWESDEEKGRGDGKGVGLDKREVRGMDEGKQSRVDEREGEGKMDEEEGEEGG